MTRGMHPKVNRALIATGIGLAVIGYAILLWRAPWWLDGGHLRETDLQPADGVIVTGVRTALVAIGAGVVAGWGLWFTNKSHRHAEKLYLHSQEQFEHAREKDRDQADLAREGQYTERYVEAIKLLSSEHLTQRLGGIYALERIMRDSEKDHATVVEVLAAFARQHAKPTTSAAASQSADRTDAETAERRRPAEDVQAVLTVLGRRPMREEAIRVDLSGAHLEGVNLLAARLDGANLLEANLEGANLFRTHLEGANLVNARLDGANLVEAHLDMAIMIGAHLEGANLLAAHLTQTFLSGARLEGTDLRKAEGLTPDYVVLGVLSPSTKLPPALADHPDIQARIAECEQAAQGAEGIPPDEGEAP